MRTVVLFCLLALACASAPAPKTPDESHRVPVNYSVPAELAAGRTAERSPRKAPQRSGEVYWR